MNETNITRYIMLAVSRLKNSVVFRNNVGMGWVGNSKRITRPITVTLQPGDVVISNARPLQAGLCEGSSDLIGWTAKQVTPEMVGKTVAVFTAIEVKKGSGRATAAQLNFISRVRQAGGIAGLARTPDEAAGMISGTLF
jgi:hypothetical protein